MSDNNTYRVLFVCLGNICRSPAGEGIFKKMIKENGMEGSISVDSAGTSGYHIGDLPDPRMRRHGERRGCNFDSLSRKFTARDFADFDIILAMDDNNYRDIMRLAQTSDDERKVHRMTDFSQRFAHDHVPDPYYSGADGFELVLDLLEDACDGLMKRVKEGGV